MTGTTVYSALKAFRFPERLEAIEQGWLPAPVHVRIKPINRCNHSCWYCAYRADDLQLGENMSVADSIPEAKMHEIVDDLIAMDVRAVTFSGGGEPLLYKPLPDVIERLGRHGIKIGCLTNGANLQGAFADALARHGTWVRVSLDAWDDASYMASRGVRSGAFDKLLDNLSAFAGRGAAATLGASFIVGRDNHDRIREVCAMLKEAGVEHVKVSPAIINNSHVENDAYHRPLMKRVAEQIAEARGLEDEIFRVVDHYHLLGERFDKVYPVCPSLGLLTIIGADQAVYACQDKAYTAGGCLGSIRDISFKTFWFSRDANWKARAIDPRRDCRHHCVGHAKNAMLWDYLNIDGEHAAFV